MKILITILFLAMALHSTSYEVYKDTNTFMNGFTKLKECGSIKQTFDNSVIVKERVNCFFGSSHVVITYNYNSKGKQVSSYYNNALMDTTVYGTGYYKTYQNNNGYLTLVGSSKTMKYARWKEYSLRYIYILHTADGNEFRDTLLKKPKTLLSKHNILSKELKQNLVNKICISYNTEKKYSQEWYSAIINCKETVLIEEVKEKDYTNSIVCGHTFITKKNKAIRPNSCSYDSYWHEYETENNNVFIEAQKNEL